MIFLNLMHNITLLITLGILYGVIIRRWRFDTEPFRIYSGFLFGGVSLVGMLNPVALAPGLIFDGRSIILSLAGLFGGGMTALIAALISAAYRTWLGGPGALMGAGVIAEAAVLGVLYRRLCRKRPDMMKPLYILLFGLIVHVIMLMMTNLVPGGHRVQLMERIALPLLTLYPLATLFLGLFFLDQEAHVRTRRELEESERKYRLLVENANSIILRWTPDGLIRFMNDYGLRFFGYSREEIVGRSIVGTFVPDTDSSGQDLSRMVDEILEDPEKYVSNENENICKDGRRVWIHWSNRAVRDENGKIRELLSVGTDITARRMMEQADRKNYEFIQLILENMPYPVYYKDTEGKYLGCNRAFQEMLYRRSENIVGKTVYDIAPPELAAIYDQADKELFAHPGVQVYESAVKAADGSMRAVVFHKASFNRLDGSLGGIVGAVQDITERKKSEEALKEKNREIEVFFASNLDLLCIADTRGYFRRLNPEWEKTLGYPLSELEGKRFLDLVHPDDLPATLDAVARLDGQQEVLDFVNRYRAADGSYRWIEWKSYPSGDQIFAAARDITGRIRAEEALRESERRYRHLFEYMTTGFALCEIITDEEGKPEDFRYLEINPAYEKLTGERAENIVGRTIQEIYPGIRKELIERYGKVALTGEPVSFEEYRAELKKYYDMLAYSPQKGQFAVIFSDITSRKKTEAELILSEEQIRNILRVQPVGVGLVVDRMLKEVNDQYCEIVGYSREEIQGRSTRFLFVSSEEYDAVGEMYSKLAEYGNAAIETRYRRKDNHIIDVLLNIAPLDRRDLLKGVTFTVLDITERKRLEDELIRNEKKISSILRVAPVGIGLMVRRVFKEVNPRMCEMVGYGREELMEKNSRMIYPAQEEYDLAGLEKYRRIAEKGTGTVETRWLRKDGQIIDVLLCATPLDPQDLDKGVTFTALDITERKRSEDRLRFLASTVEQASESVIIRDTEELIRYVNPAFEASSGYSAEEVVGHQMYFMEFNQENETLLEEVKETLVAGQVWSGRVQSLRKDGTAYMEDLSTTPIRDEQGKVVSYLTLKKDVTHELELEDQLRQSQKMEAVGLLAGGVAHDLNNMLTPILGYAEMLLFNEEVPEKARSDIQEIINAGGKARDLVGQLMAFGRKQTLQVEPLNLNEVIPSAGKLLRRTLRENIRIEMNLGHTVRSVRADRGQVEQVLMNLAVNAQDAMPKGGVLSIETQDVELDEEYAAHHSEVTPGKYLLMSVSDTGSGMDAQTRSRIFEPFFTTKEIGKGTGLGLATVYGIVKQHGGYIWVYSEPGHGSTFKIYLPAVDQDADEEIGPAVPKEIPSGTETILVAEDDPTVRELTCSMLSSLGYSVLSGSTVTECLGLAADLSTRIDCLLTDVIMPEMSGKELMTSLRRTRPSLKVIYMSGYAANIISDHGALDDGVSFIQKPFTRQTLAVTVRRCLDG